ncbi:MAG: GTPase Era [Spirochaetes bacterium GWF1_31_7]|nr:MAG: GTPase Era [Spirochaetes bacterium GWE1_32_154]OHD49031.1 MAG: GTPase Era [Spirochaetes bacterium GWF1_31_7]OHD50385.1 MAG: GTPase Era [Spirochaetes bacterium GWE2_31_10]OHD75721.1 MAG: GTPase Era [Spirochaetes bacterium RIFOXYB1_FULL_32_8]HBD93826.1 GTPase Era [Spirochaetia bacterium]
MVTIENEKGFKSGFAALIGRPSSGKSTLVNAVCGFKVSIVASQPQTTRYTVRGIYTEDNLQLIFIDTPGFHHFTSYLNKGLSDLAAATMNDGDIVLYVVDLSRDFGEEEEAIVNLVLKHKDRLIVVFNKSDEVSDYKNSSTNFKEIRERLSDIPYVVISAAKEKGLREMIDLISSKFKEGPLYYPEEFVTDQSIPFRIEEVVRESMFDFTKEEIPHSVYVKVDDLEVTDKKIIASATIFTDRNSQKGIIVGKAGANIKGIGSSARVKLEDIFERNVNLFLNVKVHENWRKDEKFIKKLFKLDNR